MSEYSQVSLLGIVVVGLMWIGVKSRYMLVPITLFATLLLIISPTNEYLRYWSVYIESWVFVSIAAISGTGILITYFLRFLKVHERKLVDYFKLLAIIFGASSPFLSWLFESDSYFLSCLIMLCAVYYYDRLVLPSPSGNRKYMIALSAMGVLTILFLVYALVQRTTAIRQREIAIELEKNAVENEKRAIAAQAEAMKQAEIARQAVIDCESKNK